MISLQDISIDLSRANTLEELKALTEKVLNDLLASLQSQAKILVLTDANSSVPAGTTSGTIVFQLTPSTITDPYGTIQTRMYLKDQRTLVPQYT